MIEAVIGRLHHVVIDCPDPAALAAFYAELVGLPITWQEDDWVVIAESDKSSGIAFQLAPPTPSHRSGPTPTGRSNSTWTSWSTTSMPPSPRF